MADRYPGFELWETTPPTFPFPVGDLTVHKSDPRSATVSAKFTLPKAQPHPNTVAERSVGIKGSSKLSFALECTTDAQGKISCEAVLRGRHVNADETHNETKTGELVEIRLTAADLAGSGWREEFADHEQHCDMMWTYWSLDPQGRINCTLDIAHSKLTVAELKQARAAPPRVDLWPKVRIMIDRYDWMLDPSRSYSLPAPAPEPKPIEPGHGN